MPIEKMMDATTRLLDSPTWKATEYLFNPGLLGACQKAAACFALVFTVPLALCGETIYFISNLYFQTSYLFYKSDAPEATGQGAKKFLTLNGCMFPGGLPIPFGGVAPASQRMDEMAKFLKTQDADVVCMQEMAFGSSADLIDKLKDHYRYFYYRIGPNPYRMESALFWASKYQALSSPKFVPFDIPNMQKGIRRGFFIVELSDCYVVTTHLDPHTEGGQVRAEQIKKIIEHMNTMNQKPIFFMGDLNIEAQDTEALHLLRESFQNFKEGDVLHPNEQNATCCENLPEMRRDHHLQPTWSVVDHILVKNSQPLKVYEEKVKTFNPHHLCGALSDHRAVVLIREG